MPAIGELRARAAGEPVSDFNLTDEEREMHDRVWRFLIAPHADDWFMDTVVELQRTRIATPGRIRFEPGRYYRWLGERHYESSRVRYATLADHARSDSDTAPSTFGVICRVLEIDRQRDVASRELGGLSGGDVAARREENQRFIGWFTVSLRFRFDAYSFALDRLLVETPHREAVEADRRLTELSIYVEAAERGDFCVGGVSMGRPHQKALPSRLQMGGDDPRYRK